MLKRCLLIPLLVLYLIPTTGLSLTVHFCGDRVTSFTVSAGQEDDCACGAGQMKKGCCKDKNLSLKVRNDQVKTNSIVVAAAKYTGCTLLFHHTDFSALSAAYSHYTALKVKHPPPLPAPGILITQRVFRI